MLDAETSEQNTSENSKLSFRMVKSAWSMNGAHDAKNSSLRSNLGNEADAQVAEC
jgi:hypothetical protein